MSNLGKYQQFTTEAARAGGVDALLAKVGSEAVVRAAPALVATGVVLGLAVGKGWRYVRDLSKEGKVARERLRSALEAGAARDELLGDDGRGPHNENPSIIKPLEDD